MSRKLWLAGACIFAGMVVLCSQTPSPGMGKKDDLAKQNQQLKKALAERDQQINQLEAQVQKLKANDAKDDAKIAQLNLRVKQLEAELKGKKGEKNAAKLKTDLDAANQTIRDKDAVIASLQSKAPTAVADLTKENSALRKTIRDLQAVKKAPFVHTVILKIKTVDDAEIKKVQEEAGKTLAKITVVRSVYIGKPVENGTPELAQKGYQLGVVVLLDDADALQKFLDDTLHKQFMDTMGSYWERPLVYDFQRDPEEPKKDPN